MSRWEGPSAELSKSRRVELRRMLDSAYDGDFSDQDWDHALGGRHWLATERGCIVAHVAVVPRCLTVGEALLRTGFVEAVATASTHRRRGLGTELMRAANDAILRHYELGGLCTGEFGFYARTSWQRWRGPTYVERYGVWERTPEEDDAVMILRTPGSPAFELDQPIACDWRPGDVW